MSQALKYVDLDKALPKLPEVLLNTIQSEFLEIKSVKKDCDKFEKACVIHPELCDAFYVVYSSYVKKSEHKYEKFIFLGKDGEELCDLGGRDFELYGLLSCINIPFTQEYENEKNYS